jgi:hypothetical protein
MELTRLYAYSIEPLKNVEAAPRPEGGAARLTSELRSIFESLGNSAEANIKVDFQVDQTSRTNSVRDEMMRFGFGSGAEARSAAAALAARLGSVMDRRSSACLLVLGGWHETERARVSVWMFPKDEALRLRRSGKESIIEVLSDIFSRTSRLRKAAVFEGKNRKADFLRGRILDFQVASPARPAADFWIRDFLHCLLALHGEAGTRELARCLRKAYEAATVPSDKEAIYSAIASVRHSPRTRWSLRSFAETYLHSPSKEVFLQGAANTAASDSMFDFDREVFERALNFRVFQLEGDVYVSAPFDQVGPNRPVSVTADETRQLTCSGVVVSEAVRGRRHA